MLLVAAPGLVAWNGGACRDPCGAHPDLHEDGARGAAISGSVVSCRSVGKSPDSLILLASCSQAGLNARSTNDASARGRSVAQPQKGIKNGTGALTDVAKKHPFAIRKGDVASHRDGSGPWVECAFSRKLWWRHAACESLLRRRKIDGRTCGIASVRPCTLRIFLPRRPPCVAMIGPSRQDLSGEIVRPVTPVRATPKAQPARKRSGRTTARSRELWRAIRCMAPGSTEGVRHGMGCA
jgi:hypothetical protein